LLDCVHAFGSLSSIVWPHTLCRSRKISHSKCVARLSGVTNIQTDVATKKVLVTADDSVSPEDMLEKLQKVSLFRRCMFFYVIGHGRMPANN
jgi:copper chaperone CopZ